MDLDQAISHSLKVAASYDKTNPDCDCAKDHRQLASWLSELSWFRHRDRRFHGVSICVVTYNSLFYTRLQIQQIRHLTNFCDHEVLIYDNGSTDGTVEWLGDQDVTLIRGSDNSKRHGDALDMLVGQARFPITCTLCSDAFPVSPEWLTPALHLDDETVMSGITKGWGNSVDEYVCPSYLFGITEWLAARSFADDYPNYDTGERLRVEADEDGLKTKTWRASCPDMEGFKSNKPCDYNGWVWHTWWSTRKQVGAGLREFEPGYHEHVKNMLRKRFDLDF